jgi:hypothetical protein
MAKAREQGGGQPGAARLQLPPGAATPAKGRSQGLALSSGKGRVVVLGEAGFLSAQIIQGPAAQALGRDRILMGMNRPGLDNQQIALNILHWLSGLLPVR